jgi:hypothetical protein
MELDWEGMACDSKGQFISIFYELPLVERSGG